MLHPYGLIVLVNNTAKEADMLNDHIIDWFTDSPEEEEAHADWVTMCLQYCDEPLTEDDLSIDAYRLSGEYEDDCRRIIDDRRTAWAIAEMEKPVLSFD